MKVLCVGEMLIDFTPVEGMTNTYTANPGGAPANVAVSVARNRIETGFLGKLGNDDFGRLLVTILKGEGINILIPKLTDAATTTLAFVTLDSAGNRSFTFARKPGADILLCEEDVNKVDFGEWDIVHAGSVSQSANPSKDAVILALKKAKEAGKMVSFDVNYRDKIWSFEDCKREVDRVLEYVDLLKISDEETDFVGGVDNIPNFMKENNIAIVVLTKGGDGADIYYEGDIVSVPSIKVSVVDTTGAGDAYWGGFLSALLSQNVNNVSDITLEKLKNAGQYGAVSGGLCIRNYGGIPAIPYKEDIEKYIHLS